MLEVGGLLKAGVSVGGYANRGAEFVGGLEGRLANESVIFVLVGLE
ncbi:hypothetical protein SAMN06265222_101493 [Neorhodopirellula lusitana]|uniref:Uncharacterized protein n=1 Tax=Neorhodopirellula lusitana TaxID=445327 RepID=A0ABY1PP62_9BACT|nr:hypothetical protein SAMN06265222_101493 [Neorhodopirellula lusitana]